MLEFGAMRKEEKNKYKNNDRRAKWGKTMAKKYQN